MFCDCQSPKLIPFKHHIRINVWTNQRDSSELPILTSWVSACENCYFPKEAHGLLLWLFICIIIDQGSQREGPVMWEDTQTQRCSRALGRRWDGPRMHWCSQDGLTLPGQMDTRPHLSLLCSHRDCCEPGALGLYKAYLCKAQQVKPLHCTAPQHCTDGQTDTQRCPSPCSPWGTRQADALTGPAAWWAATKSSSLRPETK